MFDDGPRVLDTDLATALGMGAPRNIRPDLIRPNKAELEGLGVLQEVSAKSSDPRGRGRPAKAYYLNEEQALLVCVLSRTEAAKLVRAELIQVFMAYRRGELVQALRPAIPTTMVEALRLAADEMERRVVAEAALIEAAPKVEFYDGYVDATGLETLRTVAKILGRPERAFVQTLISDRVLFRSPSHRYALMPFATYAKAGYFEVKTGTTSGHLWAQTRWTPKGVAWATSRYGTKGAA